MTCLSPLMYPYQVGPTRFDNHRALSFCDGRLLCRPGQPHWIRSVTSSTSGFQVATQTKDGGTCAIDGWLSWAMYEKS
jgi:hypothetical protein